MAGNLKLLLGAAVAALTIATMATATLAAEHVVVIEKMKFGPAPAQLHVGDTIVWKNADIFRHTATADDKSFDVDLPPRSEARMTLEAAGSFAFLCRFHPGMKGTLVVLP